jgi:hypothetical protein
MTGFYRRNIPATRNPEGVAAINWGHRLADELKFLWLGFNDRKNLVDNSDPTEWNTGISFGDFQSAKHGRGAYFDSSATAEAYWTLVAPVNTDGPVTIMAVVEFRDIGDEYRIPLSVGAGVGAWNNFYLETDTSSNVYAAVTGGNNSWSKAIATTAGTQSTIHTLAGVFASSSSRKIYVDGVLEATDTTTDTNTGTLDTVALGNTDVETTNQWAGNIYFAAVWNRELSPGEIQSLYVNPYQLLRGRPSIVPSAALSPTTRTTWARRDVPWIGKPPG